MVGKRYVYYSVNIYFSILVKIVSSAVHSRWIWRLEHLIYKCITSRLFMIDCIFLYFLVFITIILIIGHIICFWAPFMWITPYLHHYKQAYRLDRCAPLRKAEPWGESAAAEKDTYNTHYSAAQWTFCEWQLRAGLHWNIPIMLKPSQSAKC